MTQILIGYVLIILGLAFTFSGITQELGKKMENKTGKNIVTQRIKFNNEFTRDDNSPVGTVEFLVTEDKK